MFSQTVEYALRAMMYLSENGGQSATATVIAKHVSVPTRYMSKVMRNLVIAGLVRSQRGPHGGFTAARSRDTVSMLDVVNAVEPIQRIRECPLRNPLHVKLCPMHSRLDALYALVERELGEVSIGEMVDAETTGESCRLLTDECRKDCESKDECPNRTTKSARIGR